MARCQVRELTPNVVSIDFQRRNLLAHPVSCPDLTALAGIPGEAVDLRRVWAGRTEYGRDWHLPLTGPASHTLTAGATGAGKNSVMWCPLVTIAPAIRDGLVRVSGIDPKGMELAYGRGIFARYAVTGPEALTVLDELIEEMAARKAAFAGWVRVVPVTRFSYTPWYGRNTADQAATTERCRWERRGVAAGVGRAASGDLLPNVACEG